ncbi:MAG: PUA domain-containing protein, partial [Candidatus Hydrothermarchaeales archaeon]
MQKTVKTYSEEFKKTFLHKDLEPLGIEGETFGDLDFIEKGDDNLKIRAMADYQYGKGAGDALFSDARAEFARTGRIRRIYSNNNILLATVRASDGFLIPTRDGAKRLQKLEYPRNRVIIEDEEVCEIVKEGKSVFAKFVKECDPEIRPYQEVIVVGKDDRLLASGKALLSGEEMLAFERGIAVKVRRSIKN